MQFCTTHNFQYANWLRIKQTHQLKVTPRKSRIINSNRLNLPQLIDCDMDGSASMLERRFLRVVTTWCKSRCWRLRHIQCWHLYLSQCWHSYWSQRWPVHCICFAVRWLSDMNLITLNTTTKLVSIRMTNSFCLVLHRLACSADIINVAVDAMKKFRHLPYRGLLQLFEHSCYCFLLWVCAGDDTILLTYYTGLWCSKNPVWVGDLILKGKNLVSN